MLIKQIMDDDTSNCQQALEEDAKVQMRTRSVRAPMVFFVSGRTSGTETSRSSPSPGRSPKATSRPPPTAPDGRTPPAGSATIKRPVILTPP